VNVTLDIARVTGIIVALRIMGHFETDENVAQF